MFCCKATDYVKTQEIGICIVKLRMHNTKMVCWGFGKSLKSETVTTETIVKVPKFRLSVINQVLVLRRLKGRLRSCHPIMNALQLISGELKRRK